MSAESVELLRLLETHGAQIHALLTRLTLRAGVAEDLLQELFLKLRRSQAFAQADNKRAYAFKVAIHLAFDWRRSRGSTRQLPELSAEPRAPLDGLIDAEELEQILDAMRHLSDLGRQVLVLRYLEQQEYAVIASQLGKSEHQVRGLCHKALGQLRSRLNPIADARAKRGTGL